MRSGGSVLKALSAAEGALPREREPARRLQGQVREVRPALPREHRPQAGCAERCREHRPRAAYTNCLHTQKKALRYVGEPFLYVLELANLNLDGIAGMRSGGSVLEAPPGAEEGALPREHRPRAGHAELYREHHPRAGHAELYREREPVRRYW